MEDKIICGCYKVKKSEIVESIKNGADTVEKIGEATKVGTGCGKCKDNLQEVLDEVNSEQIICGCYKVKKSEIIEAIKSGADTVGEIGKLTKAGTGCGRCKDNIESVIKETTGRKVSNEKGFFEKIINRFK